MIHYIEDEAESLSAIPLSATLAGKYCFVDIWATWCAPCRQEFAYNDVTHDLLAKYPDLVAVYISIDDRQDVGKWEQTVEYYRLSGYHLLAGASLLNDIREKLFDGENATIPRYILLSPDGTILCSDMPRPSRTAELARTPAEYLR